MVAQKHFSYNKNSSFGHTVQGKTNKWTEASFFYRLLHILTPELADQPGITYISYVRTQGTH